jgi:hypothetical protein
VDLFQFKTPLAAIRTALSMGALRSGIVMNLKWIGRRGFMFDDLILGWRQNLDSLDL